MLISIGLYVFNVVCAARLAICRVYKYTTHCSPSLSWLNLTKLSMINRIKA